MNGRFALPRVSTLQAALVVSIGVHAALLSLRIAAPERFDRLFQDTPLEVILLNTRAKSDEPEKAQALAQTALAGGGELREGRAASPLPSAAVTAPVLLLLVISVPSPLNDDTPAPEAAIVKPFEAEVSVIPVPATNGVRPS